jgi:hypothetical protein
VAGFYSLLGLRSKHDPMWNFTVIQQTGDVLGMSPGTRKGRRL